jgi:hypothetical protein
VTRNERSHSIDVNGLFDVNKNNELTNWSIKLIKLIVSCELWIESLLDPFSLVFGINLMSKSLESIVEHDRKKVRPKIGYFRQPKRPKMSSFDLKLASGLHFWW